ncbi:ABC transporter family substrate-binding protein [Amycolatopsis nigrescens]|uniref:ABC transporter family substrate-binding protein n=1 Tax=Amycolatopsis nigrescens TaxID=381445 RepID=UPI0003A545A5|nr:ABC transporter family substrate-binding protein [Amycolatopsis nigrescens]
MTRTRHRGLAPLVCAVVAALALSACGGGTGNGQGNNIQVRQQGTIDINEQPPEKVKQGGTFTFPLTGVIQQYNYQHAQGAFGDVQRLLRPIMPQPFVGKADGSVEVNKNYVESAEVISGDPQVVEIKINRRAKWSNGTPITWRDFEAAVNANSGKTPGFQPAVTAGFENVAKVERGADDQDVKITFARPYAEWKGMIQFLYPAAEMDTPEKFNKGWIGKVPVTGGPFRMKNIDDAAKTVTVEADPTWWGDKPKLDVIVFQVATQDAGPQAFASGALDAIDIGSSVPSFQAISQTPGAVVRKALSPNWRVLHVGAREGSPLRDLKVRQAVFQGIDRTTLVRAILGPIVPDATPLQNHIYVGGQQGYRQNGTEYGYDKGKAAQLLDEAGWVDGGTGVRTKDGKPLELRFVVPAGVKVSSDEAQLVQRQLGEIGIKITVETVDLDSWQNRYLTVGNFDLLNMSWLGTPFPLGQISDIYTYDPNLVRRNYGRVPDTQGIGDLFRVAQAELDDQKRMELGNRIDDAIWREFHSIPLYQRPDAIGVRSNVANFGAFGFATPDWTKVGFTA